MSVPLMNLCRAAAYCTLLAAAGFPVVPASAALSLAAPFTDHAVLQRDRPVPLWGRAGPRAVVTVEYRGQKLQAAADGSGRWRVALAAMAAAADGADLSVTTATGEAVTLHDVVVGEVWLASGQSNMEWSLSGVRDAAAEIAAASHPLIRHLRVEHVPSDTPADSVATGGWKVCTPATAGEFTAVGYFFARDLAQKLGVPVGLIHSSWGATPIESWLALDVLQKSKAWPRFNAEWQEALKVFPQRQAEYPALEAAWRKASIEEQTTGKKNPLNWPHPPVGPGTEFAPGALFNGMIRPLAPYALRGALWYQGESNVGHAEEYAELLPLMIRNWRDQWDGSDFPFYVVQLPNYADTHPGGRKWARLREAQSKVAVLPNVGMVVTIDVGNSLDIHPPNKRPVGERLAQLALVQAYGKAGDWSGPVFQTAIRAGSSMRVRFAHAAGLASRTPEIGGFEIAGEDRVFHRAMVQLDDRSVIVSSPEVPEPVAVRYAWTNDPACPLVNAAGLPAAPFRTDDWPVSEAE